MRYKNFKSAIERGLPFQSDVVNSFDMQRAPAVSAADSSTQVPLASLLEIFSSAKALSSAEKGRDLTPFIRNGATGRFGKSRTPSRSVSSSTGSAPRRVHHICDAFWGPRHNGGARLAAGPAIVVLRTETT
jgi:hypothetical protein